MIKFYLFMLTEIILQATLIGSLVFLNEYLDSNNERSTKR